MEMRWQAYGNWRDQRGRGREIQVRTFADERVAHVYESSRRDELIQAIYRCRPHDRANDAGGTTALTVVLMTAMPVTGLPVDELRFSGNSAKAEESLVRLDEAQDRLHADGLQPTARSLAEAAQTNKDRAAEYLSELSAVCPPTCIREMTHVGGQGAETLERTVQSLVGCTCPPCPANRGDRCNCGRFWKEPQGGWHCGNHDSGPPAPEAPSEEPGGDEALNGQLAESMWSA